MKKYYKQKYGVEYYSQHPDRNDKVKKTSIEKYGVEHFSKSIDFRDKVSKTNLDKFGFINPFMDSERIKKIFTNKYGVDHPAKAIDDDGEYTFFRNTYTLKSKRTEWQRYKTEIRRITRHNIKNLEWNGTDYYDNEYIKENFSLHHLDSNYPTIDHKTSIFDGFVNNIPIEVIASVDNLCWTKRIINITKNKKSHN